MQENIVIDETNKQDGYQILIVGIKWSKDTIGKFRSKKDFSDKLPEQMTVVLPENIAIKENDLEFNNLVESWTYNFLAKRFNHIANYCQIWLPLKEVIAA